MSWHWLFLVEALWVLGISTWITLEKRAPQSTLAWIFGLAFLPVVGIGLYLLVGPRRLARQRERYNRALAGLSDYGVVRPP
ncbi:MAG TPA: PLDc N-terminal domain-containing protein, partial [Gaiellaceae bacterium]|nr:PLDc N-terminal domain-containing protein [Gaiellaceae bacterium]